MLDNIISYYLVRGEAQYDNAQLDSLNESSATTINIGIMYDL